jgi:hypothetical protein
LEKQIEKQKRENEKFTHEKIVNEKKLVNLETDNNDLLSKARELEFWADELKSKLDAALEENIILHNEADAYKAESEEVIQRLQEDIEELKNEVTSKEKIINRVTMHRDFLLKSAGTEFAEQQLNSLRAASSLGKFNTPSTPISTNKKISEKLIQTYSKTFLEQQPEVKFEKKYSEDVGSSFLMHKGSFGKDDIDKDEDEETEFIRLKIDAEIKNILDNRRNFVLNTLIQENFSFDVISGGFNPPMQPIAKKNKKIVDQKVLDEILNKVQARKEKILGQKKLMQVKLEKIGFKIL